MPNGRSFEEEALPDKLNFGIWGRIGRYALRKWPLLLILLFTMLLTTFYDSSFVPMMNKAAYTAADNMLTAGGNSIWDITLSVHFIFGFDLNLSFQNYIILFAVMIMARSFAIFGTFLPHEPHRNGDHDRPPARYLPPDSGAFFLLLR
jgi:hypothetical protein